MFVSPAEPPILRALGETSVLPERFGCDVVFLTTRGLFGLQRKEVSDYISSKRGDRLGRLLSDGATGELTQMVLLLEGAWPWEFGGRSIRYGHYTRAEWESDEVKIQQLGLILVRTENLQETVVRLPKLEVHFAHGDADSLLRVPKQRAPAKLRPWMAMDGINLTKARAIDAAGITLAVSCSEKEMCAVPRMGKVSAAKLKTFVEYREDGNGNDRVDRA